MTKSSLFKCITIALFIFSGSVSAGEETGGLKSLRGNTDLTEVKAADDFKKFQRDTAPIARDYVQQPPLIPHTTRDYKITLKDNKCLSCHSWSNYKESGATKISFSHYKDRNDKELADVAPRRYFCNQCHAPQADAQPILENDFKPVDALSKK